MEETKLQAYRFPFGWQAVFPADWEQDFNEQSKENLFSPPDSDMVFALSMIHVADPQGNPAPEEVMADAVQHILPLHGKSLHKEDLELEGLQFDSRVFTDIADDETTYCISAAYYCPGELMTVRITGSNEQEVMEHAAFLRLISRIPEADAANDIS